jgi:hypothetical protein
MLVRNTNHIPYSSTPDICSILRRHSFPRVVFVENFDSAFLSLNSGADDETTDGEAEPPPHHP